MSLTYNRLGAAIVHCDAMPPTQLCLKIFKRGRSYILRRGWDVHVMCLRYISISKYWGATVTFLSRKARESALRIAVRCEYLKADLYSTLSKCIYSQRNLTKFQRQRMIIQRIDQIL